VIPRTCGSTESSRSEDVPNLRYLLIFGEALHEFRQVLQLDTPVGHSATTNFLGAQLDTGQSRPMKFLGRGSCNARCQLLVREYIVSSIEQYLQLVHPWPRR